MPIVWYNIWMAHPSVRVHFIFRDSTHPWCPSGNMVTNQGNDSGILWQYCSHPLSCVSVYCVCNWCMKREMKASSTVVFLFCYCYFLVLSFPVKSFIEIILLLVWHSTIPEFLHTVLFSSFWASSQNLLFFFFLFFFYIFINSLSVILL